MIRTALAGVVMGASIVFGAVAVFPVAAWLDARLFPVLVDWTVTQYSVDEKDIIVSGLVRKRYDCEYLPPPRARDLQSGKDLLVDSGSPTSKQSWPASPIPRPFGPWRVLGGAGKDIEFFQVHRCNPLWPKVVRLGEFQSVKGVE